LGKLNTMQPGSSDWQICAKTHDRLGESILWHPIEEALYWIDYYGPSVHRKRGDKTAVETWKFDEGSTIGSLVLAEEGLLIAMDHGLHFFDTRNGGTRYFADPKNGNMGLIYNDAKVDRAGRYWVGTLCLNDGEANGSFYRVSPDGFSTTGDGGFSICNGPAFSPDNRKLYFSDSILGRILCYDLSREGLLSGRRTFFSFLADEGLPDGLTVDSSGNVWCALYGGGKVVCIDPEGVLRHSIPVPASYVTSLCLGGPGLRTLFVTTGWNTHEEAQHMSDLGGTVFMRRVDIPGIPEPLMRLAK
jgi:sugar lactone lactonase YvrE